jgi:GT2 family glycosyltransferase
MKLNQVSIVIVTYKGDEILFNCLESLAATCGEEPQIVVVDNSPSEATKQLVTGYPNAQYVESPGNPGFAGGNNLAIPFCDRKYILLLNNDTVVKTRKSIEDLVVFMESYPKCGVAQGSIVLPNANGMAGGCGSFLTPFGFQYARGFAVPLALPGVNVPIRCFSAMGAFMMFPRGIISSRDAGVGFLFYDHFKSYYEESDFCHRVWLSGKEVWYVPTDPIEHLCGYTAGKFKRSEIMRQYMRNSFFSLRVNLGLLARMTILPIYYFVMLMHALVHLVRKDKATFDTDMEIFKDIFRMRKEVCAARKRVIRSVSDWWIFRRTLRLPPISYLLRTVSLNI